MKILAVIDSFKGSMSSLEAGQAAASGILRADPSAEVNVRALADGGEGTVEALISNMNGRLRSIKVTGPLGDPVVCEYGIIDASKTAVIEMAGAAGLVLVPEEKRNPLYTTTYGVGEVIRDAIGQGCRRFIVGIGELAHFPPPPPQLRRNRGRFILASAVVRSGRSLPGLETVPRDYGGFADASMLLCGRRAVLADSRVGH